MAVDLGAVLDLSGELQRVTSLGELVAAARQAVTRTTRYRTCWLIAVEDAADGLWLRILAIDGAVQDLIWDRAPRFPVGADPFLREVLTGDHPVVVDDMATDPRTDKEIVARTQHHSVVCVPMRLGKETIGALATGSFGPEGVIAASPDEVENLTVITTLVTAAYDRIRLLTQRDEADARAAALAASRESLEEQLRHAQRLEAVGLLAGGVAHDFNNLLTAIACHADLALGEGPPPALRESLEVIRLATDRGAHLTRNLLALSRRRVVTRRRHDLREIARRAHALVRAAVRAEIELTVDAASTPVFVLADDVELEHAVLNLVANARDAIAGPGRITVRTGTASVDDAFLTRHGGKLLGRVALLTVEDSGGGMDEATLARVFEPFFSTKLAGSGTGLGLATVRAIVEQHGGSVDAESQPGVGTTFTIALPLAPDDDAPRRAPAETATPETLSAATGETVLVAEDDDLVRGLLGRLLRGRGYRVIEARDGQEAIERFRAESATIDLVLTDLMMPRRSGLELVDAVRAFLQDTPIVVLSGYTSDPEGAARLGALGLPVIDKPTTPLAVLSAVRRALDRRGSRGPG